MTETDVLLKIVGIADMAGDLEPEDAMSAVAGMINRLDKTSENYRRDMEGLLLVGATIWKQAQRHAAVCCRDFELPGCA